MYRFGSGMLAHQRQPVIRLLQRLDELEYERIALAENIDELVELLAPACQDPDDCWPLAEELAEWGRWQRAEAYCVAYVFQTLTSRLAVPAHISAAVVFADAQIAIAEDLALDSVENAWRAVDGAMTQHSDSREALKPVHRDVLARLRLMHAYYARWSRPFDYAAANPLTDNLYFLLQQEYLDSRYPDHTVDRTASNADKAAALLRVAEMAESRDDVYHWLIARKHAAAYLDTVDMAAAEAITRQCVRAAQQLDIEAEIGHLLRQHAWELTNLGDLHSAEYQLEAAMAHEQPVSVFGHWYALSARELGDVRSRMVATHVAGPETAMDRALEAYRTGRQVFDFFLDAGGPMVGAAVKRQMLRSYTDNAIGVALERDNLPDALAELESSGPRALAEALAETRALREFDEVGRARFLLSRSVFHHHLTSVPRTFDDYVADLPAEVDLRYEYTVSRDRMRLRPGSRVTDAIVSRLNARIGDDLVVLAFFLSQHHTSRVFMLDLATGGMANELLGEVEQPLRRAHHDYVTALQAAAETPGYPPVAARRALDVFLATAATLLAPALEMLEHLAGRHVVVVPQRHLNTVPMAALPMGDRRLIDVLASISTVPSLGLLTDLLDQEAYDDPDQAVGLTTLHETAGTPFFAGTLRQLADTRAQTVVTNSGREGAIAALGRGAAQDVFFACHGQFDNDDPALSALRIAPDVELALPDLWSSLAQADLRCVILGACESGLARAEIGSEYVGLAGALLSSGARTVVGSLWQVNQLATALLLADLLTRLATSHDVPTALADAQRRLRDTRRDDLSRWISTHLPELETQLRPAIDAMPKHPFAHPDDWAGFVTTGIAPAT